MLAARLCFAWGVPDVESFLESTPPEVLDFWMAFDRIEPIGESAWQSARLEAMLYSIRQAVLAFGGQKTDCITPDECMPPRYLRYEQAKPKTASIQSMQSVLQSMALGGASGGENNH